MNERKYESTLFPCGDALEKMDLFAQKTGTDENTFEPEKEDLKLKDE